MSRTFAYCRVSANKQDLNTQLSEIANAGFQIDGDERLFTDTKSGAKPAVQREGFKALLNQLEKGDRVH